MGIKNLILENDMNIQVEISSNKLVKAGDVYINVKDKESTNKIQARMIAVQKGDDGQDCGFVIVPNGSIHRIKLEFIKVVDTDYVTATEESGDTSGDWWDEAKNIWDSFKQ